MKSVSDDGLNPADIEELVAAYDFYIAALRWEKDRFLALAEKVATERGEESAKRLIVAQAEYIRERAIR